MILFHASTAIVEHPDIRHSRDKLDFGRGFYTTTMREQAMRYAERFVRRGMSAYINEYDWDEIIDGFCFKSFPAYDEEWLDYVTQCRKGQPTGTEYDVVEGGVANDRVFNTIDLYFAGQIAKDAALERLKFEKPNHQLCFLNNEMMIRHLRFVKAERI